MSWEDAYRLHEQEWDSYEELYDSFSWELPETFNLARYVCDRWADDDGRIALHAEPTDGSRTSYTYAELATLSNQLANAFANLGVERGDRVALAAPQRVETLLVNLAAWKLGAISVPLAPQFGPDAMAYRVGDSGAAICVVGGDNLETIRDARSDLPSLENTVAMDDEETLEDGELSLWSIIEDESETFDVVETDPDEDAVIVFTSGTTGDPKGVRTPHRLLIGCLPGYLTIHCNLELDEDTTWRTPAGWGWMVFFVSTATLFYGGTLVAYDGRYDPEVELELIERYDVTNWFAPPTVIRMMMQVEDADTYDVDSVRTIPTGGEAVGQSIIDWADDLFGNCTVNEAYGQSEALLTIGECGAVLESKEGMMGKPVPGHEVDVVDTETAEPLGPGEVGEIAVKHEENPVIFNGYWNKPELTEEKFVDGWLLTEDLGKKDEDGYVSFQGRKDDVIICSGYRVSPEELEETLATHEAVADAGVIGVDDETRGKVPKAFIVAADSYSPSDDLAETLQHFIKDRLAPYEYPRYIEFIDELPTTRVSGKLKRSKLREWEGDA
ncbi:acyl-CoA synthetase [Natrialbaceae archaeon GCM10025810]|uniref:acyl-CoA synthetase n=1 Tax=Halovalidus salilacus TaxID=3075124 RepID=UPI00361B471C